MKRPQASPVFLLVTASLKIKMGTGRIILTRKPKNWEQNLYQCHFVQHKSQWDSPLKEAGDSACSVCWGGDGRVVTHSIRGYENKRQGRNERHFCLTGKTKSIFGLEGFQAPPGRPCERNETKKDDAKAA
jgi:hypothetical protein